MKSQPSHSALVLMLGALTALTPFSIDMYLPAFPQIAHAFGANVAAVAFSLSSYFIGLAAGQLIYGPLMDRFGRKRPLMVGLIIYLLATVGCMLSKSVNALIAFRFIQALGGCGAGVGAFAMVRDLFEPKESAKIFSLLILILGASPLFAPTLGGYLSAHFGWPSIFLALFLMGAAILLVVVRELPESHAGDETHILRPLPILKNYASILCNPQFSIYTISGAVAFAGLFVYLAASPSIFMEIFGVSTQTYGWIFSIIAVGFVGMSQLNIIFLRKYSNEGILHVSLTAFMTAAILFVLFVLNDRFNLYGVMGIFFIFLSCVGLANPNASALAMAPFSTNAGSAAAMLGFVQMTIGAGASTCVGLLKAQRMLPLAAIFAATSVLALLILVVGERKLRPQTKRAVWPYVIAVLTIVLGMLAIKIPQAPTFIDLQENRVLGSQLIRRFSFASENPISAAQDIKTSRMPEGLHLDVTGEDPWLDIPIDPPLHGPIEIGLRMKSSLISSAFVGCIDPDHKGNTIFFDAHHDGLWHDYTILVENKSLIALLRIKPGMGPGEADIAWCEVRSLELHPLRVTSIVMSKSSVRMQAVNDSTMPVRVVFPKARTVRPGGKIVAEVPRRDPNAFETIPMRISIDGYPDIVRVVTAAPEKPVAQSRSLVAGQTEIKIAPDGSGAHVYRRGQIIAVIAPLIRENGGAKLEHVNGPAGVEHFRSANTDLEIRTDNDDLSFHIRSSTDVEGPVVRMIGDLKEAVLPGLEYLDAGDVSSSDRDILGPEHIRFSPDPTLVTSPLIGFSTERAAAVLIWKDTTLHPTFASPDSLDGLRGEHRFSLRGKTIDAVLRFSNGSLSELFEWAFKRHGWPPVKSVRSEEDQRRLSIFALDKGGLKTQGGWFSDSRATAMHAPFADLASAQWRLTGEIPDMLEWTSDGSAIRNDAIYFVTGHADVWKKMRQGEVEAIERRQTTSGLFRVALPSGEFRMSALGETANDARILLSFALLAGDKKARDAGVKAMRATRRGVVPSGAQTWALNVKTPDALAAAYLIEGNILAFETSQNMIFLSEARRWAIAGLTFVYSWGRFPEMEYAVVPALGAPFRQSPVLFGRPVPWVSTMLAHAFARLAEHDIGGDWKHVAAGIAASVDGMRPSSGDWAGCLPDAYKLAERRAEGPFINPAALVNLQCLLAGNPESLETASVGEHVIAAPYKIAIDAGQASIHAPEGTSYEYMIDGRVQNISDSTGDDPIDLIDHYHSRPKDKEW